MTYASLVNGMDFNDTNGIADLLHSKDCAVVLLVLCFIGMSGNAAKVWAFDEPKFEVVIPDPQLRTLLSEVLKEQGVENDVFTTADLKNIVILNAADRDISDITGLQSCENLRRVNLSGNSISDMTPLSACAKLRSLDISRNHVKSIRACEWLEELQVLNIEHNQVSDLAVLERATQLRLLAAGSNQIASADSLPKLPLLHSVFLADNSLSTIPEFPDGCQIEVFDLRQNTISDISPLAACLKLKRAFLQNNEISDLSFPESPADATQQPSYTRRFYLGGNAIDREQLDSVSDQLQRLNTIVDITLLSSVDE